MLIVTVALLVRFIRVENVSAKKLDGGAQQGGVIRTFTRDAETGASTPYEDTYYYETDKRERYEAFAAPRGELSAEDIVWMVNANLDKPFYTGINEIEMETVPAFGGAYKGLGGASNGDDPYPLLVNKYNKLPDDYEPSGLVTLASGRQVTAETKDAFLLLCAEAKQDGMSINDLSAYRSIPYQKTLYDSYLKQNQQSAVDIYSARPGHSEHHTGRALDICGKDWNMDNFVNTAEFTWVSENAYKYGFILRYAIDTEDITGYKYEPWHITYVGKKVAAEMKENGISTLEEYVVKYIDHSRGD